MDHNAWLESLWVWGGGGGAPFFFWGRSRLVPWGSARGRVGTLLDRLWQLVGARGDDCLVSSRITPPQQDAGSGGGASGLPIRPCPVRHHHIAMGAATVPCPGPTSFSKRLQRPKAKTGGHGRLLQHCITLCRFESILALSLVGRACHEAWRGRRSRKPPLQRNIGAHCAPRVGKLAASWRQAVRCRAWLQHRRKYLGRPCLGGQPETSSCGGRS